MANQGSWTHCNTFHRISGTSKKLTSVGPVVDPWSPHLPSKHFETIVKIQLWGLNSGIGFAIVHLNFPPWKTQMYISKLYCQREIKKISAELCFANLKWRHIYKGGWLNEKSKQNTFWIQFATWWWTYTLEKNFFVCLFVFILFILPFIILGFLAFSVFV